MYEMKIKNFKRIYVDIVISFLIIAVVATFFAFKSQTISQEQVLNTLSEISSQSVNVIDKEIQKNVAVLANLSIYISQEDAFDPVKIINKIKKVNEINNFKRIGIIDERGQSYTTDDNNILLNEQQMTRFNKAMNGEVSITDTLPDLIDGEEVSVYTLPITFDNDQHCVLFGAYASRYYKETLSVSTFDGLGYSFIIKENGDKIVDSSNKTSIKFSNFFDDIGAISKENKEKLENLKHNIKNEKSGFLEYDRTDEARYLYYQKLDVNDWYLLSVIPASVVDNNINGMLFLGYMMLGCCLLGILYLITRIVLMYRNNQKRLEEVALVDEVTGCGSYTRFRLAGGDILKSTKSKYTMVYFNILKFQYINDLYGYDEGNLILVKIAKILNNFLQEKEFCARIQADHFVALLQYDSVTQLKKRAEYMIKNMENAINSNDEAAYRIKMIVGIYLIENYNDRIESMVDRAATVIRDENRHELENCNFYNDNIRQRMYKNKELEDLFEEALHNHEFEVYFQPKYSTKKKRLYGAEALVRWKSSKLGSISPGEFIPVLERSSNIIELDEYVFVITCKQIRKWLDDGLEVAPIAVNVSQLHLYRQDFVESYLKVIDAYQIPYNLIELEMTETSLFDNRDILKDILNKFRKLKITVSMDDFGSGYSSIMMLESMPIDCLKIDKTMIDDLEVNSKAKEILKSIISLAQSLGLVVVAEGVEQAGQYEELIRMKVDYIQGYYCARPLPLDEYEKILKLKK